MKLFRSGHRKNKGVTRLVDTTLRASMSEWQDGWYLYLRVVGSDGKSQYDYELNFSGDELASLVETALTDASHNGAIHAQAKAIGAFIREVLDKKNQKDFLDKKNQAESLDEED